MAESITATSSVPIVEAAPEPQPPLFEKKVSKGLIEAHEDQTWLLGRRFRHALDFAFTLHEKQTRKAGKADRPYFLHLMAVTSMVLELDGTEDEAIAAMLHDSVEDQCIWFVKQQYGAAPRSAEEAHQIAFAYIRKQYGDAVADIVTTLTEEKLPPGWRKWPKPHQYAVLHEANLVKFEKLRRASPSVRRVKGADALHNLRSLFQDLRTNGPEIWEKFAGGKSLKLWQAEQLIELFHEHGPKLVAIEMERVLEPLKKLAEVAEV